MATAKDIEDENRERANRLEGASVDAANEGLKALLLINGGACVAILGFLASTMGKSNLGWSETMMIRTAARSLLWFSAGAGLAVATSVFAYLCNREYSKFLRNPVANPKAWMVGGRLNSIGIILALASLGSFFCGAMKIGLSIP